MKKDLIRAAAENDLEAFIRLVHPNRVLGGIHSEIIRWWNREDAGSHQLLLMPRDHQKSALIGYRAAWSITRDPAIRILYISSTSNLAVKQLKFIKDILTSDIYRFYWPEMVLAEDAKREKWTETEISVDHPKRRAENVRDPTVFTAGLTTTITGLHSDIQILDDVVVKENAYTEDGRHKVEEQYSLLASIAGAEGKQWAVGTRYHPKDLYNTLQERTVDIFDQDGTPTKSYPLYEVFGDGDQKKQQVESRGDGTGEYLWPRQQRSDGKWFGFSQEILAVKKSQYLDAVQFRAQYYNNPNDESSAGITKDNFQYYERNFLARSGGVWFYKNNRLNVFAAVDFAFSVKKNTDYTAIVVVGVDSNNNYYVLDVDRFKTDKISDYFNHILRLHQKWDFRKITAEVTAAQDVIVNDLKTNYIARHGLALSVEKFRPTRNEGTKEERVRAILQPRYENGQIWHYQGGHCQTLEEELILSNPAHDDVKDCLASCVDSCITPSYRKVVPVQPQQLEFHARFGGVL